MSKTPPNRVGESISKLSSKDEYPQKAKGMSFFAFLLSIFVYISVFYTFNLSPSSLFNTTKFWFFISNTLILIIAADYGAFSSSKQKHDLYEDYMLHSQVKNNVPSVVSRYPDHVVKERTNPKQDDVVHHDDDLQGKKEILAHEDQRGQHLHPESKSIIANISHDSRQPRKHENLQEKKQVLIPQEDDKIHARNSRERESGVDKLLGIHDESKNIMSEDDDQKHEEPSDDQLEDHNEFSTMSDEELNRRVEEFIDRFNRQIRLQSLLQEK